jgi:hypothetical protein
LAESTKTEPFWQQREQERERAVSSYYIYQPSTSTTDKANIISPWNELCPSIWRPKEASLDVTITWTVEDSPKRVAQELIHRCASPSLSSAKTSIMVDSLTESLETFGAFCQEQLTDCNNNNKFKARIVATRGPASGAKCPQWHVDHVPIRWIQSLIGPGCEFVTNPDTGVDWSVVNGLFNDEEDDEDVVYASVEDRNRALVDTDVANIYSAREQEAILLVGNRWNEFAKTKTTSPFLKPVVHKSPSDIPMWQGRVLLTQDVLVDE